MRLRMAHDEEVVRGLEALTAMLCVAPEDGPVRRWCSFQLSELMECALKCKCSKESDKCARAVICSFVSTVL